MPKWGQESTSTSWEAGFPLATVITVPRTCRTGSLSLAGQGRGDTGVLRVSGVPSPAGEREQGWGEGTEESRESATPTGQG